MRTFLFVLFFVSSSFAAEYQASDNLHLKGQYSDNLYAAAGNLNAEMSSSDDVFLAGGEIFVKATSLQQDLFLAGGKININDLRALSAIIIGGDVLISKANFRELVAAAGNLRIENNQILDDLTAAAGNLTITSDTRVAGTSTLAGGKVTLAGHFSGDVKVYGDEVYIEPSTVIEGNLTYGARKAEIDPKAEIRGQITAVPLKGRDRDKDGPFKGFALITLLIGALFVAPLTVFFFSKLTVDAQTELRTQFWPALGKGVLIFIVTPVLVVFLLASVFATAVGLALIPFVLFTYVVVWAVASLSVGNQIRIWMQKGSATSPTRRDYFAWTLLGTFLLAVVFLIPVVGFIAYTILMLASSGALYSAFCNNCKKSLP